MLSKITLLTSLIVSVIYPLCFWISRQDPLKKNFHRFHLGLPTIIGGIALIFILLKNFPLQLKTNTAFWEVSLMALTAYYWKKEYPNVFLLTLPSILGLLVYSQFQNYLIGGGVKEFFISILAGGIFCSVLYAMNLGHWYLNVHGLPLKHLIQASFLSWILILMRGVWDVYAISVGTISYRGNATALYDFLFKYDGFFLWIAILFGIVFPFTSFFFVKGTLKVKNTQATTGILYVILSSIVIGDMTFKYYLIKYGIAL